MNLKILYKNLLKNKLILITTFIIILFIIYYLVYSNNSQEKIKLILKKHCNITINGSNPQDIIVTNDKFYNMVLTNGELGLAESYMSGYWYSNNLYETFIALLVNYDKISYYDFNFKDILSIISNKIFNRQTIDKALVDVQSHYDIGNDLYTRMLDKNMQYTCGFWQDTNDLDTAQLQKMKIIGQKLNLKQGDTLLDIGCGWGYLINFLSKEYNVKGIGITLSEEQLSYAKDKFKDNKNADYQLMDYRNIPKDMKFNKIVSVGMLEHVGAKNYKEYFDVVNNHFKDVFVQLFNGGKAHLELVDSDDPLEAGLEMMVSPPGKKLQSMSLLSGGEQALTAMSLIFAVFLTNPSPICVLDEVDAPLDDANVERFCNLLDDIADKTNTKFLIITHHALTMSRMDRLFGVTMAERGVSQIVSVDLKKAEEIGAVA